MSPARAPTLQIFVSYAREDREWVTPEGALIPYLTDALRRNEVAVWCDTHILPGQQYEPEILAAIDASQLALLMISESFLSSDYIQRVELPRIRERARQDRMVVIPILVSPCDWTELDFISSRQMLPGEPPTPLSDYTGADRKAEWHRARAEILKGIRAQIALLREGGARPGQPTIEAPRPTPPAVAPPPAAEAHSLKSAAFLAGQRLALAMLAPEQLPNPLQAHARAWRCLVEMDRMLQWLGAPAPPLDPDADPAEAEELVVAALPQDGNDVVTVFSLGQHVTLLAERLAVAGGAGAPAEAWARIVNDHREALPLALAAGLPAELVQQFAALVPAGARAQPPPDLAASVATVRAVGAQVLSALRRAGPEVPAARRRTLDRLTPLP